MAAASSSPYFGIRDEDQSHMKLQVQKQPSSIPTVAVAVAVAAGGAQTAAAPAAKKKRNLPGTPNPDAEVIALSPKTLMATNRFICEVCNKGFQREQNLQLHRRGHNLPWKLRQKNPKEVRRRVYLCPEPTCVHHDPSRALGDLTGIKKHFCRKHGEKKWKCDKCSKRYAVQSDWKAHSKTCGTREYRCDCGTLFSRRDSFITHRAFCDALAQESTRLPTGLTALGSHLYGSGAGGNSTTTNAMSLGLSHLNTQLSSLQQEPSPDLLSLGGGAHLLSPSNPSPFFLNSSNQQQQLADHFNADLHQTKPFHGLMNLPDLQTNTNSTTSAAAAANLFNLSFFSNSGSGTSNSMMHEHFAQKNMMQEHFNNNACSSSNNEPATLFAGNLMSDHQQLYNHDSTSVLPQMSATALLQKAAQMGSTTSSRGSRLAKATAGFRNQMDNETHLQDLMNSLANGSTTGIFGGGGQEEGGFVGFGRAAGFGLGGGAAADGLTRDFLGVGSMMRMSAQAQSQMGMGSMDSELKSVSSASGRSFAGGSLQ